jgi:hypothetical protein
MMKHFNFGQPKQNKITLFFDFGDQNQNEIKQNQPKPKQNQLF